MATLQSPGVSVQIVDESFYLPAAPGTTPMIFVASAEDKTNPSGSTALGTTAENAGKVWLITSQRDLTDTFGTPLFYTDASGNPQHGNELNEYGLQAAYSLLGVSSRAYVVRADLNTKQLVPSSSQPKGDPDANTYWVDTDASVYGIKEWNSSTQAFTVKTPIVLDDNTDASSFNGVAPAYTVGQRGDYCLVLTDDNASALYYKTSATNWTAVVNGFDGGKRVQLSPHFTYPIFDANTATGSVWVTTTVPANGANWSIKYFDGNTKSWVSSSAPIYSSVQAATYALDPTGGGKNINAGQLFVESNFNHATTATVNFKVWKKNAAGSTVVTGDATTTAGNTNPVSTATYTFQIRETLTTTATWGSWISATLSVPPSTTTRLGSLLNNRLNTLGLTNVVASWNSTSNKLTLTHTLGGNFQIFDGTNTPFASSGFSAYNLETNTGTPNLYTAVSGDSPATFLGTNWKPLDFEAKTDAPYTDPADGTLWYNSVVDEVDIMYHNGTTWVGYKTAFPNTSPNGPIVSAVEPDKDTGQSDGTPLVNGDIWINTADTDRYGRDVYVWNSTQKKWILQDVTDQSTPDGWLFADARWATTGSSTTASPITDLLESSYLDPDAPDPALYPRGMRLWNTRRSGFNVKKYVVGYINPDANNGKNQRFPSGSGESMASYAVDRWVSQYPTAEDGGPQFGRKSQRAQVVNALKELIDSNTAIRDTDTLVFNLISAPGYPEAIQNMIAFNTDRKLTAFVVGDTPFRLNPTGTALSEWALNANTALDNGEDGAVSYDEYMAMWYPSGFTNDNTGNFIVVPPSHMMLRTIVNSDNKSYQWFAPAGTRRGGIDNATSVGYLTNEGEFKPVALYEGLRDVLYNAKVNPIATLTGVGLVAYGQKTRARNASALDRINVARLVAYMRRQLDLLARPFLFEPNDAQTRREIKAAAESFCLELVGQRALYDFIVVCDETNNTPSRIDRNELWLDIAVEPVKAIEFIYIPLRLKNTGDIAAGL